ncbi:hypothetical protein, partial [Methyloversatilis thermotolerans]|uniref:hypothetical protein n=1 Tax=Methyloversatilis thermotolerans TaxID=1346290 RepID=UPI001E5815DD
RFPWNDSCSPLQHRRAHTYRLFVLLKSFYCFIAAIAAAQKRNYNTFFNLRKLYLKLFSTIERLARWLRGQDLNL